MSFEAMLFLTIFVFILMFVVVAVSFFVADRKEKEKEAALLKSKKAKERFALPTSLNILRDDVLSYNINCTTSVERIHTDIIKKFLEYPFKFCGCEEMPLYQYIDLVALANCFCSIFISIELSPLQWSQYTNAVNHMIQNNMVRLFSLYGHFNYLELGSLLDDRTKIYYTSAKMSFTQKKLLPLISALGMTHLKNKTLNCSVPFNAHSEIERSADEEYAEICKSFLASFKASASELGAICSKAMFDYGYWLIYFDFDFLEMS